jgi:hypothetical protein
VDLNGKLVNGRLEDLLIPAQGTLILTTDGVGEIVVGSATVCSNLPLAGVIVFAGPLGLAGVPNSEVLAQGFTAPIIEKEPPLIRTGFAVMNLENQEIILQMELLDEDGTVLATAELPLVAMGQLARYADEIPWVPQVKFTDFRGSIRVTTKGRTGAAVIQGRPQQLATMPVSPAE